MIKYVGYCDGSITITWSLNIFINYFTSPNCWLVSKKQFCQVFRVRPVHSLKVLQFHLIFIATLSYSKFVIIPLQRKEFTAKSHVSRKMFFCKW